MAVKAGDILRGKYRLDTIIGRGGMGEVFAATDISSGGLAGHEGASSATHLTRAMQPTQPTRPTQRAHLTHAPHQVAIKVVSRSVFTDVLVARLQREAEAAARIRSDYVPTILDVERTDDGELFLVMERLVGESLSERLRSTRTGRAPVAWEEVDRIGEDILRGLIDAHTAGVVHRDLKPSNVFLALKGGRTRAMVLDFGVCKIDAQDLQHLTGTGEAIGTIAYMAPEQIRGASAVDDRADLYAFGVLVFEMVCGRLPHEGPSQIAILASKLENPPARLRDHARVPAPEGLDELVAKALSRDPNERFASAQELLKAWRKLGRADATASNSGPFVRVDVHEAPTGIALGPHLPTMLGPIGAGVPREARPTHMQSGEPSVEAPFGTPHGAHSAATGMTTGLPARRGTGATSAMALAAFGLLGGVVVIIASVARTSHHVDAAPANASTALAAPLPTLVASSTEAVLAESAPVATVRTALVVPNEPASNEAASTERASTESAPDVRASDTAAKAPKRPTASGRKIVPAAAKPAPPHITAQPRY